MSRYGRRSSACKTLGTQQCKIDQFYTVVCRESQKTRTEGRGVCSDLAVVLYTNFIYDFRGALELASVNVAQNESFVMRLF